MKPVFKILTVLIVLATIGVGVLFALQNKAPVPLDILIYNFAPRSIALWVLLAFGLGGVGGLLFSSALVLRTRAALGSANRKLAKARVEMDRLRTVSPQNGG